MDQFAAVRQLRGFNYTPSTAYNDISFWRDYDEALVERELTYAQRLGLNSARVFLAYVVWEHDGAKFLDRLRHFVRAAHARGISTMPVVWDSCFSEIEPAYDAELNDWIPNPGVMHLGPDFWPTGERYCAELVQALGAEPGLAMWDVMNEPLITSWVWNPSPDHDGRVETIWTFVRHFCEVFARLDPAHPRTVGVHTAENLGLCGEWTDVLSFHDYSANRRAMCEHMQLGLDHARRLNKPVFVSEIACLARANPYDVAVETCRDLGLGWYIWELMIGVSRWRDIHGIVYPDGTVRDPSIVAAVQGFFRKRTGERVAPNLDKEGAVSRTLEQAQKWLAERDNAGKSYDEGLRMLDTMANLLEAGEVVPMVEPPSVKVLALEQENAANSAEADRLLAQWSDLLQPHARQYQTPNG